VRAIANALITIGVGLLFTQSGFAQDSKPVQVGERIYNNYCFTCHGENLVSSGQTFDLRRLRADERLRFDNSVRNGKGQMPPWKDVLSDQEIDGVWHYIRANAQVK